MKKGVIGILSAFGGAAAGTVAVGRALKRKIKETQEKSDKHLALFLMMNQWVKLKQAGKSLTEYFEWEGYRQIAVYGMHYAGETLVEELAGSNIEVKYGIDRNADQIYTDLLVVTPDSDLEKVDAVVVTSIQFFEEIKESLSVKIDCPIISLEEIIHQM